MYCAKQPKCQGWCRKTGGKIPEASSDLDNYLSVGILCSQSRLVVCSLDLVSTQVSLGSDMILQQKNEIKSQLVS